MTTDQKGAIAEAAVSNVAVRLGFGVLKPVFSPERYDLVFDLHPGLIRVQCKWARCERDAMIVRCFSCRRGGSGMIRRAYREDEVDAIAAYCAAIDSCYLIPMTWIGSRKLVQLRLRPARNNQHAGVTMASEFEMESLDWRSHFEGP